MSKHGLPTIGQWKFGSVVHELLQPSSLTMLESSQVSGDSRIPFPQVPARDLFSSAIHEDYF